MDMKIRESSARRGTVLMGVNGKHEGHESESQRKEQQQMRKDSDGGDRWEA